MPPAGEADGRNLEATRPRCFSNGGEDAAAVWLVDGARLLGAGPAASDADGLSTYAGSWGPAREQFDDLRAAAARAAAPRGYARLAAEKRALRKHCIFHNHAGD